MKLIIRVGNKRDPHQSTFIQGWRDGQIIDIRPDDYQEGRMERKHFLIVQTPHDYWALRGSTDWKSDQAKVLELKKFLTPVDSQGKYPWEFGYLEDEKRIRARDWFVDIEKLLADKWITQADHDGVRDFSREYGSIILTRPLEDYLVHEDIKTRIDPTIHNMAVSSGTFSIGSGLDYATVTAFEADIADPLTGALTGEHNAEETAISTVITFDTETAGNLLKLTAQSGDEHNGGAYGNGARIIYGTGDSLNFDETTDGDLAEIEVSKLALDITGNNNSGINIIDVSGSGDVLINRMLMYGNAQSVLGINNGLAGDLTITNNIFYSIGNGAGDGGIKTNQPTAAGPTHNIMNNTIVDCYRGIRQERAGGLSYTLVTKNNLIQASGDVDFSNNGGGFGTTAKNVSEDATSPDASYQSKDVHTNSVFLDYANDDYRLDVTGDATNLAILDDGDDLSGTFTDDIQGQTRSTWYIGASEIVAGGDVNVLAGIDVLTLTEYPATVNAETNVQAGVDALILTTYGATVDLSTDTNVNASVASLTLTEYPATVNAETNVQAAVDALTLAEYSATVNAETNISANAAALTLTEYPADVNLDKNVQAAVDALTLTTYAASVSVGADVNVLASVAALTLTAYPATVNAETNIQAGVDALTLTTYAASVTVGADVNVMAGVAALTLTEYPATVNAETNVQAAVDALTLVTYGATITQGVDVNASVANLTLTAYQASVNAARNIQANLAALTLTEYPATVNAALNVAAGVDPLILSALAATVSLDVSVSAGIHALTLTEYAASVTATSAAVSPDGAVKVVAYAQTPARIVQRSRTARVVQTSRVSKVVK